jgi:hypothetical protein
MFSHNYPISQLHAREKFPGSGRGQALERLGVAQDPTNVVDFLVTDELPGVWVTLEWGAAWFPEGVCCVWPDPCSGYAYSLRSGLGNLLPLGEARTLV